MLQPFDYDPQEKNKHKFSLPNRPPTTGLKNKSKATFEIFRCRESIQVIIIYLHMKFRSNRTMLNLCGIVVAILKMAIGRNFSGRL
jgi:hypothetical protein